VVGLKRNGLPLAAAVPVRAGLDGSEIGPVIHVVTPRRNATRGPTSVSVVPWGRALVMRHRGGIVQRLARGAVAFAASLFGCTVRDVRADLSEPEWRDLEAWENFEALAALSRNFNREAGALAASAEGSCEIANSLRELFATDDDKPSIVIDAATAHASERAGRLCQAYAIADALARRRQRQFRRDWQMVYTLGFIAFLCFALFSVAGDASNWILVAYSLAFVAIFALFARAHAGNHQVHFLDYRALAEALRVAVFSRLVGVCTIAQSYPIVQPNELAWVKIGLNALELVECGERTSDRADLDPASEAIAREFWVKGQLAFFRKATARHTVFADRLENIALVLLTLSPFLIVPCVILLAPAAGGEQGLSLRDVLLLISGLLPGLGTALNGYSDKLALKAQARQYDRMRMVFERASGLFPARIDAETAPLVRALYVELGTEALKEQAEWVAIYRQRPIEPPK
jgi:hypothetical protein